MSIRVHLAMVKLSRADVMNFNCPNPSSASCHCKALVPVLAFDNVQKNVSAKANLSPLFDLPCSLPAVQSTQYFVGPAGAEDPFKVLPRSSAGFSAAGVQCAVQPLLFYVDKNK